MDTATLSAKTRKKKAQHDKLAGELLEIQEKYAGEDMPENVGEDFEAKCQEAEALWEEIEGEIKRVERLDGITRNRVRAEQAGRQMQDVTLPADSTEPEAKSEGVAGYVTLGTYVSSHPAMQKGVEGGFRNPVQIGALNAMLHAAKHSMGYVGPNGEPLVALDAEERKAFEQRTKGVETKATPTIGSGVIEPERLDVIPQVTADDRLRLRDVLFTGQTGSSAVSYIREESYTRAAAETAAGSLKPEAGAEYSEQTAPVRTIPVWMPVTTEQLADWPQLRSLIDGRLLYDIAKREEEQIVYGDGAGQNLEGILTVSGTTDISGSTKYTASDDTLEHIRVGIVEVRVAGYDPNAVLIHPYDWHDVVTAKGSDDHYLGQVFLTQDRQPRVWSVSVVETIAAEENAGNATEERNLVVGDFRRGAQLLDRMQASVMVGLNNDDFTKNKRTILAEERVAFPIYAPAAFAYLETQASAT